MKKIWQSSYSFHYPQRQNARANVTANLSNLNKLFNTSCSWKWIGWSTGVGGFISPQDGNLQCWKLVGDFRRCYIVLCWDFLRKEKGKYTVTLINRSYLILPHIQQKVVVLVLQTVFAIGFWLLNFVQLKLWARLPLQIGDSPSAVVLYLCVNFHKCVIVTFYGLLWPAICAASSTITIAFKLADIKLESSEAYLPKWEKNLS